MGLVNQLHFFATQLYWKDEKGRLGVAHKNVGRIPLQHLSGNSILMQLYYFYERRQIGLYKNELS